MLTTYILNISFLQYIIINILSYNGKYKKKWIYGTASMYINILLLIILSKQFL